MFHEKEQQGFERASDGRDWQEPGETGGQGRQSDMCIETCRIGRLTKRATCRRRSSKCKGPEAEGTCVFEELKAGFHGWSRDQECM